MCFHTMVGSLAGTDNYFRDRGYYGVESHFGVGGSTDGSLDGVTYQWQDTAYRADANLDGKPEVISIETADGGNPDRPWSPKQLDELVKLGVWNCKTHSIPPVLIPDTQPGRRGIGYHRMGCDHSSSYRPRGWPYDKWREPGGVKWSGVLGKVCPGNVRIKQLVDIVIPRIKAGVEGTSTKDWFDMATKAELEAIIDDRLNNAIVKHTDYNVAYHLRAASSDREVVSLVSGEKTPMHRIIRYTHKHAATVNADVKALTTVVLDHVANESELDPEQLKADVRAATEAGVRAGMQAEAEEFANAVVAKIGDTVNVSTENLAAAFREVLREGVDDADPKA